MDDDPEIPSEEPGSPLETPSQVFEREMAARESEEASRLPVVRIHSGSASERGNKKLNTRRMKIRGDSRAAQILRQRLNRLSHLRGERLFKQRDPHAFCPAHGSNEDPSCPRARGPNAVLTRANSTQSAKSNTTMSTAISATSSSGWKSEHFFGLDNTDDTGRVG
ncbi:unnamed protein product [Cyprideis torosa]|uniref:Uncharacterized protein n=1 Tax=Cyprideis torosa TaxID=163714 RepID=A0A7R8WHD5_9CRUS|nr:unnamed protein product [Cyprideis torosa]CAG0899255.1 unnamed protein product [Cyprideis torosa]